MKYETERRLAGAAALFFLALFMAYPLIIWLAGWLAGDYG